MMVIGKNDSKKLKNWKKMIAKKNNNNIIMLKSGIDLFEIHVPYCKRCGCNDLELLTEGYYCSVCDCYYF